MSVRIMSMVFESRGPESTEKLVLLALADHANDDGLSIYPSVERIGHKTALSERTIQITIKKLVEERHLLQLVRSGGGRHTTNEYRILVKNLQLLIPIRGEADSPLPLNRGESSAQKGESSAQKGESSAQKGEVDSPESSLTIIKPSEESSKDSDPKKPDLVDGLLDFAELAQKMDGVEGFLCRLERGLKRSINRSGPWQDLAGTLLKREAKGQLLETWIAWYMGDEFNKKTAWRLKPAGILASWPQAFTMDENATRIAQDGSFYG